MMNLSDRKEILKYLDKLSKNEYIANNDKIKQRINILYKDIKCDFYRVVVLGEFKRGKSTFINALLKSNILPMNVLPETATINTVVYNKEPKLQVVYQDGSVEEGEITKEYLKNFSALNSNKSVENVRYIKIGYPVEWLKNNIAIVDTPGVADLDETRSDITYGIIPHANAVIFILDSCSPLTKSEKDFIESRLIPQEIEEILFIANRYDCVDEEEEEFLEKLNNRLRKEFKMDTDHPKIKRFKLLPLSALDALEGILNNDKESIEYSGINEVKQEVLNMLDADNVEIGKMKYYLHRVKEIITFINNSINDEIFLAETDIVNLQKISDELNEIIQDKSKNQEKISEYIEDAEKTMLMMTDKSLKLFSDKLQEGIATYIQDYSRDDFKIFVEEKITKQVQKEIETWIGIYTPNVNQLMKKLEKELALGISYYFNRRVMISSNLGMELRGNKVLFSLEAEDISNVNLKTGLVAAAGSITLMSVVGSAIMPVLSLAAIPYLRNHFKQQKLNEAKIAIMPEVESQIAKAMLQLQYEVHEYIKQKCEIIKANTEIAFYNVLDDFKNKINKEIEDNRNNSNLKQNEIFYLKKQKTDINNIGNIL